MIAATVAVSSTGSTTDGLGGHFIKITAGIIQVPGSGANANEDARAAFDAC
jgi:hypothetical protein